MDKLNTRERNTLARVWDRPGTVPELTQVDVLRTLVERNLLDVRVTAKGLVALDEALGGHHWSKLHTAQTPYAAQVRHAHRHPGNTDMGWVTLFRGCTEYAAADQLWETLQRAGFRTDEIPDHIADLTKGHVISTEKGVEYRVLLRPEEIETETIGEH
ncbi:hypothetical protein [Streptomyces misionensis]|uniref:hypothetical protein n=1 Tax=Streptomyces misionensis TaxID=67331 RepID=UPI003695A84E